MTTTEALNYGIIFKPPNLEGGNIPAETEIEK
jgi:hypothetical protein